MYRILMTMSLLIHCGVTLAAEDARSIPVGQRQLFLDDDAIA